MNLRFALSAKYHRGALTPQELESLKDTFAIVCNYFDALLAEIKGGDDCFCIILQRRLSQNS